MMLDRTAHLNSNGLEIVHTKQDLSIGLGSPHRTAIAKVMDVLGSLSMHGRLSEIVEITALPASTVHRILNELVDLGWVHQSDDRKYTPGARLLGLCRVIAEESNYTRIAEPILQPLVEETGYTAHFALLQQYKIVYVVKLDGSGAYRMKSRVGNAVPLHTTAIGKAILATLPPAQVDLIIAQAGLAPVTEKSITNRVELHRRLQAIQQHGWSEDDGENDANVRCVAAAVRGASGVAIGGISLSGLEFDFPDERFSQLAPRVIAAARQLSSVLGHAGNTTS